MKLHLHSPATHRGVSVSVCVSVFLRYPELQQSLSIYVIVSNVIILISLTIPNPVTAMK